jgi:hypothetical protein
VVGANSGPPFFCRTELPTTTNRLGALPVEVDMPLDTSVRGTAIRTEPVLRRPHRRVIQR